MCSYSFFVRFMGLFILYDIPTQGLDNLRQGLRKELDVRRDSMKGRIIAVDFDGTLCRDCYPKIGEANEGLIRRLKELRMQGARLILWTCRCGEQLEEAIFFCMARGLIFDAVNENLPETVETFGGDSRKVFADLYIDDRCMDPWELLDQRFPA